MAKEIRWSVRADQDRIDIFKYWTKRNKSAAYSIKLNGLFIESLEKLIKHADLGIEIDSPLIRRIVVTHYLIYYEINSDFIKVLTIWDSRRNPKKFKL
ncbi:MAG TPA: type II toxin-antitoxin system RelE/ParE family toxin [Mucilaginibacter sp.]|jgi:toxin YoeB|nr:type II toxin-antitoxin system RelE/ParE family toxin [Mucilaginibacter sp.]